MRIHTGEKPFQCEYCPKVRYSRHLASLCHNLVKLVLALYLDFYSAIRLQKARKDPHRRKALRMRNLLQSNRARRFGRYIIDYLNISFCFSALFPVDQFEKPHGHPHEARQKLFLSPVPKGINCFPFADFFQQMKSHQFF